MKPSHQQFFKAIIEAAGGGGAFVTVAFDVEKLYGKKRVKIKAFIEGEQYRGTLVRMGGNCHLLAILKSIRQKIGKNIGDEVAVILEEDFEPRVVTVPPDLQEAFQKNPAISAFFMQLAYTHQKEYVNWIQSAKREETRHNRISKAVEMLGQNKKFQ